MNLAKITPMFLILLIGFLTSEKVHTQTFTTLATFNGNNGGNPDLMTLVQGFDGNLYGTAHAGGTSALGVVFKLGTGGLTVLHNFSGVPDGAYPAAGLLVSTKGDLYGTAEQGGTGNAGTVFKIKAKGGAYSTFHSFNGIDGYVPEAPLIQVGGEFYGTTEVGGVGQGNVFKMSGVGAVVSLYSFTGFPDGAYPRAPLLQGFNGNFYGTTEVGGTLGTSGGAVFKMDQHGKESVLQSFINNEPYSGLIQAPDGSFYGTTLYGGPFNAGTIFKVSADGKTLTTLHNFGEGNSDGGFPYDGVVLATDGNLYGTTSAGIGIANEYGTIYRIAPDGTGYSILYDFTNTTDGSYPKGGLLQETDGAFYGTTDRGGDTSQSCPDGGTCGVVFKFDIGLGPFVKTLPSHGKAGVAVVILGNNFSGACSVKFNGTTAGCHIVSSSEITTNVPVGATTGYVTVTTNGGVLNSNVPFRIP
jgi:uncharacterized repeat protein (TIGR03803 family)